MHCSAHAYNIALDPPSNVFKHPDRPTVQYLLPWVMPACGERACIQVWWCVNMLCVSIMSGTQKTMLPLEHVSTVIILCLLSMGNKDFLHDMADVMIQLCMSARAAGGAGAVLGRTCK